MCAWGPKKKERKKENRLKFWVEKSFTAELKEGRVWGGGGGKKEEIAPVKGRIQRRGK